MGKFKRGSYYSVNADIRGNSDFDVNLIAEDQKISKKIYRIQQIQTELFRLGLKEILMKK